MNLPLPGFELWFLGMMRVAWPLYQLSCPDVCVCMYLCMYVCVLICVCEWMGVCEWMSVSVCECVCEWVSVRLWSLRSLDATFFVFPAILPKIFRCLLQTRQLRGLCCYYTHVSPCISRRRVECSVDVTIGSMLVAGWWFTSDVAWM